MSENKNHQVLWKRLKKQTYTKKQNDDGIQANRGEGHKIEDIFQQVVNAKAQILCQNPPMKTSNIDPQMEDFLKQLSSAVENVKQMDDSCVSEQGSKEQGRESYQLQSNQVMSKGHQNSCVMIKTPDLFLSFRPSDEEQEAKQMEIEDLQKIVNQQKVDSLHQQPINKHHISQMCRRKIELLQVQIDKLKIQHKKLGDHIRDDIFGLLIWIENILKKQGVQMLLKQFEKIKNQQVKKSVPEKLINQQKQSISTLHFRIVELESEILQHQLKQNRLAQKNQQLIMQNQQLLKHNSILTHKVANGESMIQQRIINTQNMENMQKTKKDEINNPFKRTIQQYQQEIQNLQILLQELSENYQQQIAKKGLVFEEERIKINQQIQKLAERESIIEQKEEQIQAKQEQIQFLIKRIDEEREWLIHEANQIEIKKQELGYFDNFLREKMEQMELLDDQLNQGYAELEKLRMQQNSVRTNQYLSERGYYPQMRDSFSQKQQRDNRQRERIEVKEMMNSQYFREPHIQRNYMTDRMSSKTKQSLISGNKNRYKTNYHKNGARISTLSSKINPFTNQHKYYPKTQESGFFPAQSFHKTEPTNDRDKNYLTNALARQKTKKKLNYDDTKKMMNPRNLLKNIGSENHAKLLQVGSKLQKLRREIKEEINSVKY